MKRFWSDLQNDLFKRITDAFCLEVFADDGGTSNSDADKPQPSIDLGKLLAQARQEEKDKLYPEIQRLKSENSLLQKQANDAIMEAGKAKQELEDLRKKQAEGSNDDITRFQAKIEAELQAKIDALTEENKKLKESAPNEEDIRKKLEAEFEVKTYLKEQLAENKGKILSVYAKQVKGKTKEEIDAAIKKAIEDSDAIRKEVNGDNGGKDDKKDDKKKPSKNNNKEPQDNNPPAPNPSILVGDKEYTVDYIQGLKPGSKEYAEFRKQIGLMR